MNIRTVTVLVVREDEVIFTTRINAMYLKSVVATLNSKYPGASVEVVDV